MSADGRNKRRPLGDYTVGYGKPPQHTRFQPGQSGNPSGGRKMNLNFHEMAEKVLGEEREIRQGGQTRMATMAEIILSAQAVKAANGDTKAFKVLFPILEKLTNSGTRELTDEELTVQLIEELTSEDLKLIDKLRVDLAPYAMLDGSEGEAADRPSPPPPASGRPRRQS